ncbi:MAG: RbsD/FucU domain-containing protein, partial [Gammaproteobacteria bacterium]
MKRTHLLHAELSQVIAAMGHGDMLVIGDAGLPIPDGPRRIDLAVARGVPRLDEVLAA